MYGFHHVGLTCCLFVGKEEIVKDTESIMSLGLYRGLVEGSIPLFPTINQQALLGADGDDTAIIAEACEDQKRIAEIVSLFGRLKFRMRRAMLIEDTLELRVPPVLISTQETSLDKQMRWRRSLSSRDGTSCWSGAWDLNFVRTTISALLA